MDILVVAVWRLSRRWKVKTLPARPAGEGYAHMPDGGFEEVLDPNDVSRLLFWSFQKKLK